MGAAHRAGHPCTGPHLISPYRHQPSAGGRGIGRMRRTAPARRRSRRARAGSAGAYASSARHRVRRRGHRFGDASGASGRSGTGGGDGPSAPADDVCAAARVPPAHARVPVPLARTRGRGHPCRRLSATQRGAGGRPAAGQGPRPPTTASPTCRTSRPCPVGSAGARPSARRSPKGRGPGPWSPGAPCPPCIHRACAHDPGHRLGAVQERCAAARAQVTPGGGRSPDPLSSPRSSAGTVPPPPTGVPVPPGRRFRPPRGSGPPARSGR